VKEWLAILDQPWPDIRRVLLDPSDEGNRFRQNSPFCGIVPNKECWALIKGFKRDEPRAA
jgi:hypothetical protein